MGECEDKIDKDESNRFKHTRVFNITSLEDTPIYRIFRKKYLHDIISNRRNVLTNFSKWDDPFEGFLFKKKVRHAGALVALDEQLKDYYGQCWSLKKKETDARWRIYSPDKHGILVRTTFGKLWDSFYGNSKFYDNGSDHSMILCAIGRVEYLEDERIVKKFHNMTIENFADTNNSNSVKSLLIKRMEFKHEKEIRIIYDGFTRKCLRKEGLMSYPIKPEDVFCRELIADPRMPESCFKLLKWQFKAKGFNLKMSKIYEIPDLNI